MLLSVLIFTILSRSLYRLHFVFLNSGFYAFGDFLSSSSTILNDLPGYNFIPFPPPLTNMLVSSFIVMLFSQFWNVWQKAYHTLTIIVS